MGTSYCSNTDIDTVLDGFLSRYYGTYIDNDETLTIGSQYQIDINNSFQQTNEWLSGINHLKTVPIGTQSDGNYPFHVRMLQANLLVYERLLGKHYGEFNDGVPGWVRTYLNRANSILADIKGQNVVFTDDTTQGESGIGVGTFTSKSGSCNWYTNWEIGYYRASDFPRTFVIKIDGTTYGNSIGSATFKWSKDGGVSFERTEQSTATSWTEIESGLALRWEPVGTSNQLEFGDTFTVRCTPNNVPVKSGNIRHVVFRRG